MHPRVPSWPACRDADRHAASRGRLLRATRGYGCWVQNDPNAREPRLPAVIIWTVTGLLAGIAVSIVAGAFPVPAVIGAAIGLAYGLYTTRTKYTPTDD